MEVVADLCFLDGALLSLKTKNHLVVQSTKDQIRMAGWSSRKKDSTSAAVLHCTPLSLLIVTLLGCSHSSVLSYFGRSLSFHWKLATYQRKESLVQESCLLNHPCGWRVGMALHSACWCVRDLQCHVLWCYHSDPQSLALIFSSYRLYIIRSQRLHFSCYQGRLNHVVGLVAAFFGSFRPPLSSVLLWNAKATIRDSLHSS